LQNIMVKIRVLEVLALGPLSMPIGRQQNFFVSFESTLGRAEAIWEIVDRHHPMPPSPGGEYFVEVDLPVEEDLYWNRNIKLTEERTPRFEKQGEYIVIVAQAGELDFVDSSYELEDATTFLTCGDEDLGVIRIFGVPKDLPKNAFVELQVRRVKVYDSTAQNYVA
jgi:hypothetical protein